MVETRLAGSFRDPAGYVFLRDGLVHRLVTRYGLEGYRQFVDSGLYGALADEHLLVRHEELSGTDGASDTLVLLPRQVPMVSYPYEWSLSQLRDAALATLRALRTALRFGHVLKDASAFNVQFVDGQPTLIDTLSFERYSGGPWGAYRQFCQHFLAPLAVGATADPRLLRMESLFIDGLPLSIASKLLPRSSYLRPGPLFHIHLHAAAERRWSGGDRRPSTAAAGVPSQRIEALVDSLERTVASITWTSGSEWSGYYADAESYSSAAFERKAAIVEGWLERLKPKTVWDMGANTGHFSKMAARGGAFAVAFDADPACVDTLYRDVRASRNASVLPLVVDLANPSAAIGWGNQERLTLDARGPADVLLALAVTHHLAIGNNVPLPAVAEYFARLGRQLIVEFIPKDDPMVQAMLRARADVFEEYSQDGFEQAFGSRFTVEARVPVEPSSRVLYWLKKR